jgi:predicted RNA-binding Zn ribbon-like protein
MSEPQPGRHFDFSGGHLALDFANTVSKRPTAAPVDHLKAYWDVVHFAEEAGLYQEAGTNRLYAVTGANPARGHRALQEAIQLREAIFAIFSALAERRAVPATALSLLSAWVRSGADYSRLVERNHRFQWEFIGMDTEPAAMLWPIARAAAELLTSGDLTRLRICASPDCAWLFLDKTKNRRRRWCDMKICGNRVKARRHYARLKKR